MPGGREETGWGDGQKGPWQISDTDLQVAEQFPPVMVGVSQGYVIQNLLKMRTIHCFDHF